MTTPSHVHSIDDLKRLYAATVELDQQWINHAANLRIIAERIRQWVVVEKKQYWQQQLARAEREHQSNLEELHRSQITDNSPKRMGSTDARVRVAKSQKRVQLCQQKLSLVKNWSREVDRAVDHFVGATAGFADLADHGLPLSMEQLKQWIIALENYSDSSGG